MIEIINYIVYYQTRSRTLEIEQDAYHRRKHDTRIRTSTALIAREINMHELKQNSQHFS